MIIDFHTHCFPDTLAPHALDAMSSAAALYTYIYWESN